MSSLPPETPDENQPGSEGSTSPPPPPSYSQPSYNQPPPPQPASPSYGAAPQYGAPAYGSPAAGGAQPGGLLDRFLARLIDGILLGIVNLFLVTFIVVGAVMGTSVSAFGTGGGGFGASAVAAILSTAISLGYYAYMESSRGQTVGKMVMKLRTVGPDGANPTMEQAIKRNGYVAIGLVGILPVIGLISAPLTLAAIIVIAVTINNDTVNRQGWHDHFAGETRVLKIG